MIYLQLLALCFGSTADLSNYRFSVRQAAHNRLIAELPRSLPAVFQGCYSADTEVRERCLRIVRERCPVIWQAWSAPTAKIGLLLLCDAGPPPDAFLKLFTRDDCNLIHCHGIRAGVLRFDDDCEWCADEGLPGYAYCFAARMKGAREGRFEVGQTPQWHAPKPLSLSGEWWRFPGWAAMPVGP